MKRLEFMALMLSAALLAPWAGLRAEEPVVIAPVEGGRQLWLPPHTSPAAQPMAASLTERFSETWRVFLGSDPVMPDVLTVPRSDNLREALFEVLWGAAASTIQPPDRPGLRGALRATLMDHPAPVAEALVRVAERGEIQSVLEDSALPYLFLRSETSDAGFLPKALPPGPGAIRLRRALESRGLSWEVFGNRFSAWVLARAVENRLLAIDPGVLPAMWVMDGDVGPGRFKGWRFSVPEGTETVAVQGAGPSAGGLLIVSLFTDDADQVTQVGLAPFGSGVLRFPVQGSRLWLFILNGGAEPQGGGLTLTLWKEAAPPFVVLKAERLGPGLSMLLDEVAGIADYSLSAPRAGSSLPSPLGLPRFPSQGAGKHRYTLVVPPELRGHFDLRLSCRLASGGAYSAPVSVKEANAP